MTTQHLTSTSTSTSPSTTILDEQLCAFGAALREACERSGVSKRQLAAAAKLDRAAITRIEQGERAPKFDKLLLLARGAKTTPAALLAETGRHGQAHEPTEQLRAALRAAQASAPADDPLASEDMGERFAANLKWLRTQRDPKMSQEELGLEAEIYRSSPNGFETGRMKPPTLRTILKLAMGLGVSPSLLVEGVALG